MTNRSSDGQLRFLFRALASTFQRSGNIRAINTRIMRILRYEGVRGLKRALLRAGFSAKTGRLIANTAARPARTGADRETTRPRLIYLSAGPDLPADRYRVIQYAEAACLAGADAYWMNLHEAQSRLDELSVARAVIIRQVPWDNRVAAVVKAARRGGARIVFDVDDVIFEPGVAKAALTESAEAQYPAQRQVRNHHVRVQRTMLEADFCTSATDELAWHTRAAGIPTFVLPNGFDNETLGASRLAVRRRRKSNDDGLIRIGYAAELPAYQRDFDKVAGGLARILRERPCCRLVLFKSRNSPDARLDAAGSDQFAGLENRLEWRDSISMERRPEEIARFDVNLVPLEVGNPHCEARSEIAYFEAALVDAVTIASPTGPLRRAIRDGETGFLVGDETTWHATLLRLIDDPALRRRIAGAAKSDAMRLFGPMRRAKSMASFIAELSAGRESAYAFELELYRRQAPTPPLPEVPESELVFESDHLRAAEVTVIVPLFNYANFVVEALESVRAQTLAELDLIVVDDCSTDASLEILLDWIRRNAQRFNRLQVIHNRQNSGLGPSRNAGFSAAETPFLFPLDADNRLLPECCARLLAALKGTDIAFAYPAIQEFGEGSALVGAMPYEPVRFIARNFIDAMALVSKEAWASVGGYQNIRLGWEDYDFWCRLAEHGFRGTWVEQTLAQYRVHSSSMLRKIAKCSEDKRVLMEEMTRRHPWLTLADRKAPEQ
jgi:hypothetical protein